MDIPISEQQLKWIDADDAVKAVYMTAVVFYRLNTNLAYTEADALKEIANELRRIGYYIPGDY